MATVKKGTFDSITHTTRTKIEKGADVVEFEMRDGQLRRVDPTITLDSPKPEDGTREAMYSPTQFPGSTVPMAADGHPANVMPLADYDMVEPDPTSGGTYPSMLNFLNAGGADLADNKNFKAPKPADRPQGAPAVRMGTGYVLNQSGRFSPLQDDEAK